MNRLKVEMSMKFKELRKSFGLTQEEFAKKLGLSRDTYKNYEQGRTQMNYEMLVRVADVCNVSLDYLFERQNKNLIFTDSLTETQKKLVAIIKQLTPEQASFALGYFSDMLKLPYSEVRPLRPF
mgnify:CR=1 FL=1